MVCDGVGRPARLCLTAGQPSVFRGSDFKGADMLLPNLPCVKVLIADRGYDSNKVRNMIAKQGLTACIPPKKNRIYDIHYCKKTYKKRHLIENLFAKLKDWRRIATRMTGALTRSNQQSLSQLPSYFGYES
jgi:transposase